MILSDFALIHTKGKSPIDFVYFADVTVITTTGSLWWKKTSTARRQIVRNYLGFWHFVDNGEMCPGDQAEALERSYNARHDLAVMRTMHVI